MSYSFSCLIPYSFSRPISFFTPPPCLPLPPYCPFSVYMPFQPSLSPSLIRCHFVQFYPFLFFYSLLFFFSMASLPIFLFFLLLFAPLFSHFASFPPFFLRVSPSLVFRISKVSRVQTHFCFTISCSIWLICGGMSFFCFLSCVPLAPSDDVYVIR